jgi:hypothetical protein
MKPPRYRTLDGDEVELPLAMGRWVLVPRTLARFDPELTWTLDYEDAPEPQAADPRLDFAAGALMVPVERWNEHAALEPNLAPCWTSPSPSRTPAPPLATLASTEAPSAERDARGFLSSVIGVADRLATLCLAALAVAYVIAAAVWLWSLRDRITGPDVSTGLLLVGAAILLAWFAGVLGAVSASHLPATRPRTLSGFVAGFSHLGEHPLGILRVGLAVQLAGFLAVVAVR